MSAVFGAGGGFFSVGAKEDPDGAERSTALQRLLGPEEIQRGAGVFRTA